VRLDPFTENLKTTKSAKIMKCIRKVPKQCKLIKKTNKKLLKIILYKLEKNL
jgi:hypothetical protein